MLREGVLNPTDQLDSRQFYIAVRKLADCLSFGTDHSPFLGSGIEYAQSRPYEYGDPVKAIDWRVTARTGRIFIKEYEAPKRLPCYLLVDTSASMTVASTGRSKYAVAVHLAGGLALACLERISPVGVVGVGGSDLRTTPSLSKLQVMNWLHRLRRFAFDEPTTLGRRLAELGAALTNRALLIVLSDLHDERALRSIKHAAQQHDVVVLQLRDPAERSLKGAGIFRAREVETGREFVTHGRRRQLDQTEIDDTFRKGGLDHLIIDTDRPFTHQLRHFFKSRDLLGRGGR